MGLFFGGPLGPYFELNFYLFVNFYIYLFSYINKSSIEILKRFAILNAVGKLGSNFSFSIAFKAYGYGVVNFTMHIYTRWGERVFETNDFEEGWDGTHYLNGEDCQLGVYTY